LAELVIEGQPDFEGIAMVQPLEDGQGTSITGKISMVPSITVK
jgi:hypothetical protein